LRNSEWLISPPTRAIQAPRPRERQESARVETPSQRYARRLAKNERGETNRGGGVKEIDKTFGTGHVGIEPLLGFGIELRVKTVVAMLAEIEDRPGRGGANGAENQTGDANGIVATDEPGQEDEDTNAEAVGREGVDQNVQVFGFEAEKAGGAAAFHLVREKAAAAHY